MGIKFHCPNGHKLNVKAFLAGKKGVCPKCGARMRIPVASEAALEDSDEEESDAEDHSEKSNGAGRVAAPAVSAVPAAVAVAPAAAEDDPISQAPAAIWYVRPPSGGQYGPARGDVMRKWLAEGRVSGDSLVWREGWTDWQTAGKLFPALNNGGVVQAAVVAPAAPAPSTTVPISPRTSRRAATRNQVKKSESNAKGIAILVGMGLLCLVLVGVLVYVMVYLK